MFTPPFFVSNYAFQSSRMSQLVFTEKIPATTLEITFLPQPTTNGRNSIKTTPAPASAQLRTWHCRNRGQPTRFLSTSPTPSLTTFFALTPHLCPLLKT
jgi:hypothetical protein